MIRTILVSALLAGTATTVMAADLVEPVPAAPEAVLEETQVYSWDGAYLGIFGGANWLRSDLDDGTLDRNGTSTGGTIGKFDEGMTEIEIRERVASPFPGDLVDQFEWLQFGQGQGYRRLRCKGFQILRASPVVQFAFNQQAIGMRQRSVARLRRNQ